MNIKKKIMLFCIVILITFLFDMNNVLGAGCETMTRTVKIDNKKSIKLDFTVTDVGSNNTSANNIYKKSGGEGGGIFYDASNNKKLVEEQLKLNENNSKVVTYIASAVSGHYISGIDFKVTVNDKTYSEYGDIIMHCSEMTENSGDIKFNLGITAIGFSKSDKIEIGLRGSTGINTSCAVLALINETCKTNKDFAITLNYEAFEDLNNATNEDDVKSAVKNNTNLDTTTTQKKNVGNKVAATTVSAGSLAGTGEKIECDTSLADFIHKYWKYFVIFAPILLMVMITMDFFKATFSSDQDLIKKATNNAIKRVIATVLLLCLPLILSTILGFFGLELCI